MEVAVEKISRATLFNGLDKAEIEKVLALARPVSWSSGQTIVTEDELGDTIYVVYSGEVRVSKRLTLPQFADESGQSEKTLLKLDASNEPVVIGEVAMLSQAERTATVAATKECLGLEIRGAELAKLCKSDPVLGFKVVSNLAQIMCERLKRANKDVVKLATALSIAVSRGR
jgi:CRP-like cAMP-binding protein